MNTLRHMQNTLTKLIPQSEAIRPDIPPIFICALSWYASSALVYTLLTHASSDICLYCLIAGLLVGLVFAVITLRKHAYFATCIVLGISLGVNCSSIAGYRLIQQQELLLSSSQERMSFIVDEDAKLTEYGAVCVGKEITSGSKVRISLPDELENIRYGDILHANVTFSKPSEKASEWYWGEGIACLASATRCEVEQQSGAVSMLLLIRNRTIDALNTQDNYSEAAMVASALLCGYRSELSDSSIYLDFQTAGLAHMIAVSGAHLTLVCGIIAVCLTRFGVRKRALCIAELGTIACYVIITAAPVSALRAGVMACTALVSFFAKRRKASINAFSLSMIALLAIHPQNSVSISFLLSVSATFGIIVFLPLISSWLKDWIPHLPTSLRDSIALTLVASICSVPLSAAMFSRVSVISVLSNIVSAPFFLVLCSIGCVLLLGVVAFPAVSGIVSSAALVCTTALNKVVSVLASFPFASIAASLPFFGALVLCCVLCLFLWTLWPKISRKFAFVACSLVCVLFACSCMLLPLLAGTRIVMLDVGQGDSFVIQSEGKTILIDTGNEKNLLLEGLAKLNIYHIDAVIITHSDDDHCACLADLASVVRIDEVVLHQDALVCGCDSCKELVDTASRIVGSGCVSTIACGNTISCGLWNLYVLWPKNYQELGSNADSLCLLACADQDGDNACDCKVLFCGDAEQEQLEQILKLYDIGNIDVLKVGHHASKVSLNDDLLKSLNPKAALISVGADNRYGHPASNILESLSNANVDVFRSDLCGTVECKLISSQLFMKMLG